MDVALRRPHHRCESNVKGLSGALDRRFIEKCLSPGSILAGRYGHRTATSFVQACSPTGVNEDNTVSMTVAIHFGEATTMEYSHKISTKTRGIFNRLLWYTLLVRSGSRIFARMRSQKP